jgi:hypothetical protein
MKELSEKIRALKMEIPTICLVDTHTESDL